MDNKIKINKPVKSEVATKVSLSTKTLLISMMLLSLFAGYSFFGALIKNTSNFKDAGRNSNPYNIKPYSYKVKPYPYNIKPYSYPYVSFFNKNKDFDDKKIVVPTREEISVILAKILK